jgi:hypothetical protein
MRSLSLAAAALSVMDLKGCEAQASPMVAISAHGIRRGRRTLGFTEQELAAKAGRSLSYVRLLQAGFTPRGSSVVPLIADALLLPRPPRRNEEDAANGLLKPLTTGSNSKASSILAQVQEDATRASRAG